jgi:hypothetical protein
MLRLFTQLGFLVILFLLCYVPTSRAAAALAFAHNDKTDRTLCMYVAKRKTLAGAEREARNLCLNDQGFSAALRDQCRRQDHVLSFENKCAACARTEKEAGFGKAVADTSAQAVNKALTDCNKTKGKNLRPCLQKLLICDGTAR